MKLRSLALGAAAALALGAGQVLAQYPPPGGAITVSVAPNPTLNGQTAFKVRVADHQGVAAANVECTAGIASQPGSGAEVFPASFTTAADGSADLTLKSGDTAGEVNVLVSCGQLSASASVPVGAAPAPTKPGGSSHPLPPATGDSAASGQDAETYTFGALGLATIAAGAVALKLRAAKNRAR